MKLEQCGMTSNSSDNLQLFTDVGYSNCFENCRKIPMNTSLVDSSFLKRDCCQYKVFGVPKQFFKEMESSVKRLEGTVTTFNL